MKTILVSAGIIGLIGFSQSAFAQSTTGGKSGGSTASTGSGYVTEGKRPTTSNPTSMTIDDEGASRAYMYVPPTGAKNRATSPAGPGDDATGKQKTKPTPSANGTTNPRSTSRKQTGN